MARGAVMQFIISPCPAVLPRGPETTSRLFLVTNTVPTHPNTLSELMEFEATSARVLTDGQSRAAVRLINEAERGFEFPRVIPQPVTHGARKLQSRGPARAPERSCA
ncbi:hypothetical protein AAFF_G00275300 [Aldrovandia affinis]|uniref:Uncharacterized protein n=1 Tax=Aldrovandia affinis TaxID=143900 RepID=A0AAD7ST48_9TELE|nr:hypothetical protein AAFF_G00275300 [Aldrovandia affinis]